MKKILIVALALTACTTAPVPPPSGAGIPQAAEQCRAQPELDWC